MEGESMSVTPRVVAYVRVSTDKQVEHGLSLEAQQAKLMAYAALYELNLVAVEVDAGVSAKTLQRLALQRALGALKAGKAEAMAYKRRQREYTGGEPPYGWQLAADGVHLDPHTAEQAIVREALELKAAGLSLRKIGARLAARGLLPRQGRAWNPKTVRDLLQAEVA
jgi:hypothetical protein